MLNSSLIMRCYSVRYKVNGEYQIRAVKNWMTDEDSLVGIVRVKGNMRGIDVLGICVPFIKNPDEEIMLARDDLFFSGFSGYTDHIYKKGLKINFNRREGIFLAFKEYEGVRNCHSILTYYCIPYLALLSEGFSRKRQELVSILMDHLEQGKDGVQNLSEWVSQLEEHKKEGNLNWWNELAVALKQYPPWFREKAETEFLVGSHTYESARTIEVPKSAATVIQTAGEEFAFARPGRHKV